MRNSSQIADHFWWLKVGALWTLAFSLFYVGTAHAADLGSVADTLVGQMSSFAKLITAGSYVAGLGFAAGAILKFKAHRDNPTQIPVGTPVALLFVAAALLFLPSLFSAAGSSLFGDSKTSGGVSGVDSI